MLENVVTEEVQAEEIQTEAVQQEETSEEKLARLELENEDLKSKQEDLHKLKSQLGRVESLQSKYDFTTSELNNLRQRLDNMSQQPKNEDGEYLDMTDPTVAKKWLRNELRELSTEEESFQNAYSTKYEKSIKDILDTESLTAEERKSIMEGLGKQKENVFNDPVLDAKYNLDKVKLNYYQSIAKTGTKKNPNIRQEKAVATGVGGSGTETQTTKTNDSSEAIAIKNSFAQYKKMRGY